MKKLFCFIAAASLITCPLLSHAMMPVIDVAALTQLANQLMQLRQQTQLIETELHTLQGGQYQWSNAQILINNLGSVVSQANGISYGAANIDSQFKQAYPGYQPPQNYSQQYQSNSNMTLNTLNGVLQSMGASAQDFSSENLRLKFLQQQSQSSQGQTQAIQASSQIASEMVSQLQVLRQTVIAQSNAQTAYYASQVQNDASSKAEQQKVLSSGSTSVPPYGSSGNSLNPPE